MTIKKSKEIKHNNTKKRNWAFVIYPDSLPPEWKETLQSTGLQCVISPLHDKDIDPNGEPKKPHYHVIISYSGPTSFNVVKMLTDSLNAPIPQALEQVRGYYRYLTHKDNPDKYQYDEKDIKTINGFNITNFIELSRNEITEIKIKLQALIREKNILEYSDLMDFLIDSESYGEYDVASNNTYFFDKYISSRRNKIKQMPLINSEIVVNKETAEITKNK